MEFSTVSLSLIVLVAVFWHPLSVYGRIRLARSDSDACKSYETIVDTAVPQLIQHRVNLESFMTNNLAKKFPILCDRDPTNSNSHLAKFFCPNELVERTVSGKDTNDDKQINGHDFSKKAKDKCEEYKKILEHLLSKSAEFVNGRNVGLSKGKKFKAAAKVGDSTKLARLLIESHPSMCNFVSYASRRESKFLRNSYCKGKKAISYGKEKTRRAMRKGEEEVKDVIDKMDR